LCGARAPLPGGHTSSKSDDYYALLGIDAGADAAQLRRAWRRLAVRWHPDRAGHAATATFQKILAAYTVLADPVTRAAYDRKRSGGATGRRAPSVMLRRVSGHLKALLACGIARRVADDVIELLLTGQEASDGGMITIAMRVPVRCPACAADPTGSCAKCGSQRTIDELFSAWLAVPPGVNDGAVLKPSALLPGMIRPVSFRVRFN
jgi:DnaJ-class molecular chaperone